MNKELCLRYGIDCAAGIARFMGDESIYMLLLKMFPGDTSFQRLKDAYKAHDLPAMFAAAHELKGVSGSAALTALYEADSRLTDCLRTEPVDESKLADLFAAVEKAYEQAMIGIGLALA